MYEPKVRRIAIALFTVLVVIIVIPAIVFFVRDGGNQPVLIILPTPSGPTCEKTSPGVGSSNETQGESELRVYISGEVQRPGVYLLNPGARLEDALAAARPKPIWKRSI